MRSFPARKFCASVFVSFSLAIGLLVASGTAEADPKDAVVKIFSTSNRMDYYRPWQSQGIDSAVGSGFIVEGRKIVTNAHVVEDHTFVQIKKNFDPKRYTAKVEAIANDCDLALLSVEDKSFFEDTEPVPLGELPDLQDQVTVIGFPTGGDKISFTKGVVSRIEMTMYAQSGRKLLAVQIDAAINPGNSGGPVIKDGKLVGVAMQALQSGQNIGYMIPVPVIKHFFEDLKDCTYDGFPILGIDYESTENPTLRQYYGLDNHEGGVIVSRVLPFSSAAGKLIEGDIILEVEDMPIAEDGTFLFYKGERLEMPLLITKKQVRENIRLKIVREKAARDIEIQLQPFVPLVPEPQSSEKPVYYIYGGLVFSILSSDLIQSWGNQWWEKAPLDFSYYLAGSGRLNEKARQELVVLLNVLPDEVNVGYHNFGNDVIGAVNGEKVTSFKQFVKLLHMNTQQYTIIETERSSRIILDHARIKESSPLIIERNNIPSAYSDDVAEWIKGWAAEK